jgi:hypothetical protein
MESRLDNRLTSGQFRNCRHASKTWRLFIRSLSFDKGIEAEY